MNRRISHNPQLIRTLIIGNSGSGKSWLAQRLSGQLQVPWVDLDSMHWLCDEHSIARPRAESLGMARIAADEERLIKSIGNLRAGKNQIQATHRRMKIEVTPEGWDDYLWFQQNDKAGLKRINLLIKSIQREPFDGPGKPEPLKHNLSGFWSRRITTEHRLVYTIEDGDLRIVMCRYHY